MWDCLIWRIQLESHAMRAAHTRQQIVCGEVEEKIKIIKIETKADIWSAYIQHCYSPEYLVTSISRNNLRLRHRQRLMIHNQKRGLSGCSYLILLGQTCWCWYWGDDFYDKLTFSLLGHKLLITKYWNILIICNNQNKKSASLCRWNTGTLDTEHVMSWLVPRWPTLVFSVSHRAAAWVPTCPARLSVCWTKCPHFTSSTSSVSSLSLSLSPSRNWEWESS